MASSRTPTRGPPSAFYKIGGKRFYDVAAAAQVLSGLVSESTLRRWVIAGWTSFGLSLDIVRHKGQLLIPELKVGFVREHLEDYPLPRPGTPKREREEFNFAAKCLHRLEPRSTYSRKRQPRPRTPHP
jgi:hypothetical protein